MKSTQRILSVPVSPLYTAAQMRQMDQTTIQRLGVPGIVLMETAGRGAARVLMDDFGAESVAILCGRGNNGGDGFVIGRLMRNDGADVSLWLLGKKGQVEGDAKIAMDAFLKHDGVVNELDEKGLPRFRRAVRASEVAVDALFGTGLERPIEGLAAKAVQAVNEARAVVSIDIPSGVHADSGAIPGEAVQADLTITFAGIKIGLAVTPGAEMTGEIVPIDIGIPHQAEPELDHFLIGEEILAEVFPEREPAQHKGNFGHLLIVAGARGKTGAALMASESALRMGTGLVTLVSPDRIHDGLASGLPELMTLPVPDGGTGGFTQAAADALLEALDGKSAVLWGPGMGHDDESRSLLDFLLDRVAAPLILDADGLGALAALPNWPRRVAGRKAPTILTPHPGEMARLAGMSVPEVQGNRVGAARAVATASGAIVALKGAGTLVAEPEGIIFVNPNGGPHMATAGMGDVLAGLLAGLIAQGREPLASTCAAVHYHGFLADRLIEDGRERILAGDLVAEIGTTMDDNDGASGGCGCGSCGH